MVPPEPTMAQPPVGSIRWQLGLLGSTLAGAAMALSPAWWAVALFWDLRDRYSPKGT
jgi:hypothetical protein